MTAPVPVLKSDEPGFQYPIRDQLYLLEAIVGIDGSTAFGGCSSEELQAIPDLLRESARFAAGVLAPLNQPGDRQGSRLVDGRVVTPAGFADAYQRFVQAGWGALGFDRRLGGGGLPWSVHVAVYEQLTAANLAFSLCPMLTNSAVHLLQAHGTDGLAKEYLPKLVSGEFTATMCLTEADAGSDVGNLKTSAAPAGDGTWRVRGTKVFITWGDHDMAQNIIHLVLARTPGAPAGTKGLSLFAVPKLLSRASSNGSSENDVRVISIENKLGIHASPTCTLVFGESDGAVGYLVGRQHEGMRAMFTMMNHARLAVGVEGLAISERAYQQAAWYARQRVQGRPVGLEVGDAGGTPIIEHPDVRRMLVDMRARIVAMRCLVYRAAAALDVSEHGANGSQDERWRSLLGLLTPIVKAWCTDQGVLVTSTAIQVLGGLGYIEDSGMPQHLRDARIAPIYEGTNGIQAYDLVFRRLAPDGGARMIEYLSDLYEAVQPLANGVWWGADVLETAKRSFHEVRSATEVVSTRAHTDPRSAATGATAYLEAAGTLCAGLELLRTVVAADVKLPGSAESDESYRAWFRDWCAVGRYYAEQILPHAEACARRALITHDLVDEIPAHRIPGHLT